MKPAPFAQLTVVDTALDQETGSTSIFVKDAKGVEHHLFLSEGEADPDHLPGRMFVDEVIVPLLSDREVNIREVLEKAKFDEEHDRRTVETMRMVVSGVVARMRQPGFLVGARRALKSYAPVWPNPDAERLWEEPTE